MQYIRKETQENQLNTFKMQKQNKLYSFSLHSFVCYYPSFKAGRCRDIQQIDYF